MPIADDVNKMLTSAGLAAAGNLKQNVDALCKMTGVNFTSMKDTVATLSEVLDWASEAVPKLNEEAGLDSTGKLGDDVDALAEAVGVDEGKFYVQLRELCTSMGVESEKMELGSALFMKQNFWPTDAGPKPKVVDAPCVCGEGVEECRGCKAKVHPCVCKKILCKAVDQPLHLCKAKIHECLCGHQFKMQFSRSPANYPDFGSYQGVYSGYVRGAPHLCLQHPDTIDVTDDEPKKKKAKKERK
jgi:hypothetical protein